MAKSLNLALYEELDFLRFFYDNARSCMGPASSDYYDLIKESFEDEFGSLPQGYERYKDEDE